MSIKVLKSKLIYYLSLAFPKKAKKYLFNRYNKIFNNQLALNPLVEIEMFLISALIKKNDEVFDIGANIGSYCYLFEKITPSKNIYAFEPNPREFMLLNKLFPEINAFNIALSSSKGKNILKVPILKDGTNLSTRSSIEEIIEDLDISDHIKFDIVTDTVDNIIKKLNIKHLDLMKIDVEGHEFEVLKGAKETLNKMKPKLLIEIEQRHHSYPIEEIFNYIISYDYKGFFIDRMLKEFLPLNKFSIKVYQKHSAQEHFNYVNNFIFINNNEFEKILSNVKLKFNKCIV